MLLRFNKLNSSPVICLAVSISTGIVGGGPGFKGQKLLGQDGIDFVGGDLKLTNANLKSYNFV